VFLLNVALADVLVELHPHVELDHNHLQLRDIATLHGDKHSIDILGTVVLPMRGKVGEAVQYRQNAIAKYVAQKYPRLAREEQFSGAESVTVIRSGEPLAFTRYTRAAKLALDTKLQKAGERITTELYGEYRDVMIPKGTLTLRTQVDTSNIRLNMKAWVQVVVDGQLYTSIPVAFKVKWLQQALALKQLTEAKTLLTEDMLTSIETNRAETAGTLVTDLSELRGKRLRHEMEAGAVLRLEDLEEKPLVISGSEVTVFAQVGSVVVQTKAIAERDGFRGQLINAHTSNTQEKLIVEVIGEGRTIVGSNKIH
jgi:flagella basal body P-ring formation protein FlgA